MSAGVLLQLRELLLAEGGLMATLVDPRPAEEGDRSTGPSSPASIAASGPRAQGRRSEYELLVEAIYEGYLLHYGEPRVLRSSDADLGLLAGDQLYAIGLARLVALGDTDAVAELADTITLTALAHAGGSPALADAVWTAGARAVGWGSSVAHQDAKALVLEGDPSALEAMRTSPDGVPAAP
jgi:hypothetical protein